ncbi:hypothetical protein P175DRAFT_0536160 [Aspergillus ochraceoroseus IBT 24754]|uniref:Uncharacterized protein n=1 Tax=Aspergillus ochraceoroseus IBT 24754 TaxID=1392256 RepID=A0A2T5LM25_9EURO|nr:uncharacterized protein P175DRAFT_0536160 [Aspergillus ochraceoroseus IBT 24754]PTU17338.1 hypothetical protein P175DRAFT_0536160 [Aspergillus ochraceoroseus IBT 24754]
MCHGISWYHALCLHPNPTSSIRIACKTALKSGYYCSALESWVLPLVGICPWCMAKTAYIENAQPESQPHDSAPVVADFEDDYTSIEHDESYLSENNSENSIDDMELFDRITF